MKKAVSFLSFFAFASVLFGQTILSSTGQSDAADTRKFPMLKSDGSWGYATPAQMADSTLKKIKVISVIGTLPSSGNTSYKNSYAKESNGNVITAYVDGFGIRHQIAADLSGYLTASVAASTYATQTSVTSSLAAKANTSSLATVATTGSYTDLTNKPAAVDISGLATQANVDTAKANIRAEAADKYNYVDSKIVAASDTLTVYVSKKYSGLRGSASWQAQLDAAAIGSLAFTYPDPWSARDAAEALQWKTKKPVSIKVFAGNSWTWETSGSADFVQSGSSNLKANSLTRNNVFWNWERKSGLTTTGTGDIIYFKDGFYGSVQMLDSVSYGVFGHGVFKNSAFSVFAMSNHKERVYFECDTLIGDRFSFIDRGRVAQSLKVNINYLETNTQVEFSPAIEFAEVKIGTFWNHNTLKVAEGAAISISNDAAVAANSVFKQRLKVEIGVMRLDGGQGLMLQNLANSDIGISVANIVQFGTDTLLGTNAVFTLQNFTSTYPFHNNNISISTNSINSDFDIIRLLNASLSDSINLNINCISCKTSKAVLNALSAKNGFSSLTNVWANSTFGIKGNYETNSVSITPYDSNVPVVLEGRYKSNLAVIAASASSKIALLGNINTTATNSITGAGVVTIFPSATSNVSAAAGTTQGATLNVNSLFKY